MFGAKVQVLFPPECVKGKINTRRPHLEWHIPNAVCDIYHPSSPQGLFDLFIFPEAVHWLEKVPFPERAEPAFQTR